MSRRHWIMLVVLAGFWGSSFMLNEVALRDLAPLSLIGVRLGLATIVLGGIVLSQMPAATAAATFRGRLAPFAVMGVLNGAVPFFLVAWGQQHIDSGLAAILNASAPLWTALLALVFVRAEAVTGVRLVGFLLGFCGVVVLVGAEVGGGAAAVAGSLAIIASAVCYAITALVVSQRLAGVPTALVGMGTMGIAAALTLPGGLVQLAGADVGWASALAVVILGAGGTAIASMLFFGLIAGAGAPSAMLVTYIVPIIALFWGVTLLDEALTVSAIVGLALVLTGIALGTGSVRVTRRAAAQSAAAAGGVEPPLPAARVRR